MIQRIRPIAARFVGILLIASLAGTACGSGSDDAAPVADDPVAGSAEPETVSTTTSIPAGGRQPAADDPLRVLFAGDSLAIETAAPTMAALRGGGSAGASFVGAPVIPRGPLGGLFWSNTLDESDPDVVVLLIGVWERMGFKEARSAGQTLSQYRAEVIDPFVDLVTSRGAELVWVSSPIVREPVASSELSVMNEIFEGVSQVDDRVTYIDANRRITGPTGEYVEDRDRSGRVRSAAAAPGRDPPVPGWRCPDGRARHRVRRRPLERAGRPELARGRMADRRPLRSGSRRVPGTGLSRDRPTFTPDHP